MWVLYAILSGQKGNMGNRNAVEMPASEFLEPVFLSVQGGFVATVDFGIKNAYNTIELVWITIDFMAGI